MLYHKTKDLIYVKEKMGHRSISNTMKYMHLVDFVNEEWIVKIASTLLEFTSLLEQGFDYVSDFGDRKVLRKRK
jgi:hypothetical protein